MVAHSKLLYYTILSSTCRAVDKTGKELGGPVEGPRGGIRTWEVELTVIDISMEFEFNAKKN